MHHHGLPGHGRTGSETPRSRPHGARHHGIAILLAVASAALAGACGGPGHGGAPSSVGLRADAPRPTSFDARVMAYNVRFEYRQQANADGSYRGWICERHPHVVDHPELRWEHRRTAIVATLERELPDVIGWNEMRGGAPVPFDPSEPARPAPDDGGNVLTDLTTWMRDNPRASYRWVSVLDLDPAAIEQDPFKASRWPGPQCRDDMSANGCASYVPSADRYTLKNVLGYRTDRFTAVESGAFEIVTAPLDERRFAVWSRLVEHASGLEMIVVAAHLDPFSGAHRVAAARRIMQFVESRAGVPVVVVGDMNAKADTVDECACECTSPTACACPPEVVEGCGGDSAYRVLTAAPEPGVRLVDTLARVGAVRGTTMSFRPRGHTWRSSEPCWPRSLSGEGRAHVAPLVVTESPTDRVDYVLATPDARVVDAQVVIPERPTVEIDGETRVIHASDHLPVSATLRITSPAAGP